MVRVKFTTIHGFVSSYHNLRIIFLVKVVDKLQKHGQVCHPLKLRDEEMVLSGMMHFSRYLGTMCQWNGEEHVAV